MSDQGKLVVRTPLQEAHMRRTALRSAGLSTYVGGVGPSIGCLCCGHRSYNLHDAEAKYCPFCHAFHEGGSAGEVHGRNFMSKPMTIKDGGGVLGENLSIIMSMVSALQQAALSYLDDLVGDDMVTLPDYITVRTNKSGTQVITMLTEERAHAWVDDQGSSGG